MEEYLEACAAQEWFERREASAAQAIQRAWGRQRRRVLRAATAIQRAWAKGGRENARKLRERRARVAKRDRARREKEQRRKLAQEEEEAFDQARRAYALARIERHDARSLPTAELERMAREVPCLRWGEVTSAAVRKLDQDPGPFEGVDPDAWEAVLLRRCLSMYFLSGTGSGLPQMKRVIDHLRADRSAVVGFVVNKAQRTSLFHLVVELDLKGQLYALMREAKARGQNLQPRNSKGNTPAHCAVALGRVGCLAIMRHFGCDFTLKNERGVVPLAMCYKTDGAAAKELLRGMPLPASIDKGADTLLVDIFRFAPMDVVRCLMELCDLRRARVNGMPLVSALVGYRVPLYRFEKLPFDPLKTDAMRHTPLHIAALYGYEEYVLHLCADRPDVMDAKNTLLRTPLELALEKNHTPFVSKLLEIYG